MSYVLQCEVATAQRKRHVYFKQWAGIGPMYTEDINEAAKFDSEHDAMQSPAYPHAFTAFNPTKVGE